MYGIASIKKTKRVINVTANIKWRRAKLWAAMITIILKVPNTDKESERQIAKKRLKEKVISYKFKLI